MLVLTRKEGEAIIIDRDIRIVVLSHDRGNVRLGIVAPPERIILREELLQQVVAANQAAATAEPGQWIDELTPAKPLPKPPPKG